MRGHLASFGLRDGEEPGAKLGAASPWCAITLAASDPALRPVQRGTAGRSCEEGSSVSWWAVPRTPQVYAGARRGQRRSSSPAKNAGCGRSTLTPPTHPALGAAVKERPAVRGFRVGLRPSGRGRRDAGHGPGRGRCGWRGAPLRRRSPHHACRVPSARRRRPWRPGQRKPQAQAEVDQRAAQFDAAFPADRPVTAPTCRLVLGRGQPGRAVDLAWAGPTVRVAERGGVIRDTDHTPAGHGGQRRERAVRQQDRQFLLGSARSRPPARAAAPDRRPTPARPPRPRGRQRVTRRRDQPFSDRPAHLQPASGSEPHKPSHHRARPAAPGRRTPAQPTGRPWCPTRLAAPASTPGRSVELTQQLVLRGRARRDPADRCAVQAPADPSTWVRAATGVPRPASSISVIASRSIASVFTRLRPWTRRCSAT